MKWKYFTKNASQLILLNYFPLQIIIKYLKLGHVAARLELCNKIIPVEITIQHNTGISNAINTLSVSHTLQYIYRSNITKEVYPML